MRKLICMCLALLLAVPAVGLAGEAVQVSYEGAYVSLVEHRFSVFLPGDWLVHEPEGLLLEASNPQRTRILTINAFQNTSGYTLDSLLAEMETSDAYASVAPVYYGPFPCVAYVCPAEDTFGAITLSADGRLLYFFTATPYSDTEYQGLAHQILSTLLPAEANGD